VGVRVPVEVGVAVAWPVAVRVDVGVRVGVTVRVAVLVGVAVRVGVSVGVPVTVGVADFVGVCVIVGVGVGVPRGSVPVTCAISSGGLLELSHIVPNVAPSTPPKVRKKSMYSFEAV
jgi:hypothetical protein